VTIVLLFRKFIEQLIPALTRLKYHDLELEFSRDLKNASAAAMAGIPDGEGVEPSKALESMERLAIAEPKIAALEGWRQLEDRLFRLARWKNVSMAPGVWTMPMVVAGFLASENYLTDPEFWLISRLKEMRDKVAQLPDFSLKPEEAVEYVNLVAKAVASIDKQLTIQSPNPGGKSQAPA
jgi:hypothetical protein